MTVSVTRLYSLIKTNMTDEVLYEQCKKFGKMALNARRRFAGLLPEVFRRRLFEKKGFSSIFEFAARLAGMSKEQVSLVLRLERKLENRPVLREALVKGEISANKLVRVVSIATVENQEELFEKTKILSNRAIEVFVRDIKNETVNGFQKPLFNPKSMHVHGLKLDEDVEEALFEMQGKGIDINEFLRQALQKRKEGVEKRKNEIASKSENTPSRYIPAAVKKIIREEYGTKCSYPGCEKIAKSLHHTRRFGLIHDHDPHFIAPLCREHHEIAHKIDLKFAQKSILEL